MTASVTYEISDAFEDAAWDRFVEQAPGGHHVQTSLWAQVKASVGMGAFRVIARNGSEIVGGGQALVQSLPVIGLVALVPRGPVVLDREHSVEPAIIDLLRSSAFDRGARHLTVQPPINAPGLEATLESLGFTSTPQTIAPPASLLVNLDEPLEGVMQKMHKKTRYNIRLAGRRGVLIREGTDADLETYLAMVKSTAQRQGFTPFPDAYYRSMRDILGRNGHLRFTIAEYEGDIVAGQFSVPFGQTVVNKLPAWSGEHGSHHPNELLHWDTMTWAKEHGYTTYDFEGISRHVAARLGSGDEVDDEAMPSVTRFKLGFGGEARVFPGAYFDTSNRVTRLAYASVAGALEWAPMQRIIAGLRTRASGSRPSGGP